MSAPTTAATPLEVSTTESNKHTLVSINTPVSCKELGNKLFSSQKYEQAVTAYQEGLSLLSIVTYDKVVHDELESALRSNLAMVLLNLKNWQLAEEECTAVLAKDHTHIKAWYRRALAKEGLGKWAQANEDIDACLALFTSKLTTPQKKMRLAAIEMKKRLQSKATSREIMPASTQQRQDVIRLLMGRVVLEKQRQLPMGEAFFCLNWNWWRQWCTYVDFYYCQDDSDVVVMRQIEILKLLPPGAVVPTKFKDDDDSDEEDIDPPGKINNSTLLRNTTDPFHRHWYDTTQQLAPGLVRGHHFELVPREVYFALRTWYGEVTPSICRRMNGKIQLYTPVSKCDVNKQNAHGPTSKCAACWAPHVTNRCRQCNIVQYCDRSCQESHWPYHKRDCKKWAQMDEKLFSIPVPTGHVGLHNLGNTCFMASSLQCLSHATPLTRYFLSNQFLQDLNIANPLGTGGKLAHAYETVLKDIWMKQSDTTSPTALKRAIAMFAPRFAGCSQHDAQEFLAYLLDGLHEDLNRIRSAPYVELPDVSGDMNFHVAGAQAWEAHQRRNDSEIMNIFYGQFKSTCVCPICQRVSVSFDAFNHISLEIPQVNDLTRLVPVTVSNGTNVRYLVDVRKSACVGDLRSELSNLCGIPVQRLAICDVYEHSIYDILKDNRQLTTIRTTDVLVAYEVDPYTNSTIHAIATNRMVPTPRDNVDAEYDQMIPMELFGYPFLTSFSADFTCRQVWEHLWKMVEKHVDEDQKCCLTVRIVDNMGKPYPIFLDANVGTIDDDSTVVSPTSDEILAKFLDNGYTESFLFIALEWSDCEKMEASDVKSIDLNKFLECKIHPSYSVALEKHHFNRTSSQGVSLDQCFNTFTRPERLDENNMWYCSKCKEHVRAMKTMELWKLPNILVIHLKRFEFKNSLRRDKLDTSVDFPLEGLDMSRHCASTRKNGADVVDDSIDATYDLFGVTNHYGRLGFGHYTAFARKWDEEGMSNEWALFDDSSVRCIGSGKGRNNGVVSPSAYVLFYRRRTFT